MKTLISLALMVLALTVGSLPGLAPPVVESPAPAATTTPSPAPTDAPTTAPTATPAPEVLPEPSPAPYDYTVPVSEREAVEDGWFADVVFIGDSRTDGLRLYGGIKDADFLCNKGLSVFDVLSNKEVIQTANGMTGALQALEQKQYGKVYLMLGLNELGYDNDQAFADTYASVVDKLMELQPEADIYLQLLIPVNTEVCSQTNQPYYVTNRQIDVYNELIRAIAAEKQVYLLDVGEAMVDETGELPADASADGIHFRREGYKVWYEYLKTHAVEEETP